MLCLIEIFSTNLFLDVSCPYPQCPLFPTFNCNLKKKSITKKKHNEDCVDEHSIQALHPILLHFCRHQECHFLINVTLSIHWILFEVIDAPWRCLSASTIGFVCGDSTFIRPPQVLLELHVVWRSFAQKTCNTWLHELSQIYQMNIHSSVLEK